MRVTLDVQPSLGGFTHLHRCAEVGQWIGTSHRHDELEANFVIRGTSTCIVCRQRHLLTPGVLLWFRPNEEHLLLKQSADFAMWVLVFTPAIVRRTFKNLGAHHILSPQNDADRCRHLTPQRAREVTVLCESLMQSANPDGHHAIGMQWLLARCIDAFSAGRSGHARDDIHPAIEHAARLLCQETHMLGIPELARACGTSPAWLSRLFQRQLGTSITDFRNQQRMQRFLRIVGDRRTDMSAAALRAGFNSYPQFHRVFRATMGLSPRQWRQSTASDLAKPADWG